MANWAALLMGSDAIYLQFEKMQSQKDRMLCYVQGFDAAKRRFKPETSAWCPLEVLDHVIRVEESIFDVVGQHLREESMGRSAVPVPDRVRGALLTWMFLLPTRVRVPGSVNAVRPGAVMELAELESRWNNIRAKMTETLRLAESYPKRAIVFRHPVSGLMTLHRTMRFLSSHLTHHGYQLRRLKHLSPEADG